MNDCKDPVVVAVKIKALELNVIDLKERLDSLEKLVMERSKVQMKHDGKSAEVITKACEQIHELSSASLEFAENQARMAEILKVVVDALKDKKML